MISSSSWPFDPRNMLTDVISSKVTEAGPSAFATIHENYYYVFVACSTFFLVIAYFYFPYVYLFFVLCLARQPESSEIANTGMFSLFGRETKQKTLEEVAASFGDRVILVEEDSKRLTIAGKVDRVNSVDA